MRICYNLLYLNQYGIGIRTYQGKIIQNLKIDLGKEENWTYGHGDILNHWDNDDFAAYGASPIGYSSGSKWNCTNTSHHIDTFWMD